ncbi:hypothetical protein GQ600_24756 [Phytophthora cactorum]|nr:hypothetical protein GQ600_24756 [Phytophthora cactorum]
MDRKRMELAASGHHSHSDVLSQLLVHTDNHQPAVTAVAGDCLNSSILAIDLTSPGNRFDGKRRSRWSGPYSGRSVSLSSAPLHVHGTAVSAANAELKRPAGLATTTALLDERISLPFVSCGLAKMLYCSSWLSFGLEHVDIYANLAGKKKYSYTQDKLVPDSGSTLYKLVTGAATAARRPPLRRAPGPRTRSGRRHRTP